MKKLFSILLAVSILITSLEGGMVTAYADGEPQTNERDNAADEEDNTKDEDDNTADEDDNTADEEAVTTAEVTSLTYKYDAEKEDFILSYTLAGDVDYVDIYMIDENGTKVIEEKYNKNATIYTYSPEDPEGNTYQFKVVPCEVKLVNGVEKEIEGVSKTTEPYYVEFKKAEIFDKGIYVDYDINKQYLMIEWDGTGIAYVDIYEIEADGTEKQLVDDHRGESYSTTIAYLPFSKHTYKIVPYNKNNEEGKAKTSEVYTVDDYVATVYGIDASYNAETKKFTITWSGINVSYADVFVNDTPVAEGYIMKPDSSADDSSQIGEVSFNYVPQAGANYVVTIDPYRINEQTHVEEPGDCEEEEILCIGDFGTPDIDEIKFKLKKTSCDVTDGSKQYTGFSRPAVELQWNVEEDVVTYFEVYRATKNKKASYKYIGLVKAEQAGRISYIDNTAVIGNNYYKIRQVHKADDFIGQEVASSLSDEAKRIEIAIPKPKVTAKLNKAGNVALTMDAKSEIVSGYVIYRKAGSGSYKKCAEVTDDSYLDLDIIFGKRYSYRVKSFYYDSKTKKKYYGSNTTVSIKSTVGDFKAEARQTSGKNVRVSWDAAANAEGYEVYYKSKTSGDSFKLLEVTKKLRTDVSLNSGSSYCFLIKAYKNTEDGKAYFSNAEAEIKTGFTKPSNLRVEATSFSWNKSKKILTRKDRLTWDKVYGADGYYVELYNASKKKYKRVKKISGSKNTSYTVSHKLPTSTDTLTYRVRAYSDGRTASSQSLKITMQVGAVSNVRVSASGSSAKISWKKLTGADSYQVYRSNGRNMILVGTTKKNAYRDKGLSIGVTYTYYVRAVNDKLGEGEFSDPVRCRVNPPKVGDLQAENSQEGIVKLQWSPEMNVNGYIVYCKTDNDKTYKKLAKVSETKWTYTHKNVKEGETYYYKVVSLKANAGGVEAQSDGATVKVIVKK